MKLSVFNKISIANKRHLILGFTMLACTLYSCSNKPVDNREAADEKVSRPNIILVISDDLNDIAVDRAGHPQAKMPNLQRLANKGIRFYNAVTNAPLCSPSRGSFLTGIAPANSRYFGFNHEKRYYRNSPKLKDAVTMFQHFYDNGYDVFGTGKIFHNGKQEWPHNNYGVEQSYGPYPWDGTKVFSGRTDSLGWLPHPNQHQVLQCSWESTFGSLAQTPEYQADLENGIKGYKGWVYYGKPYHYNSADDRDLLPDELSTEYAINVLNKEHEKPFMLTVGYTSTHTPYYAPQNYLDRFPIDSLNVAKLKPNDLEDCADILADEEGTSNTDYGFTRYNELMEAGGLDMLRKWTQAYLACAAIVDDQLGRLMKELENSDYADNTIIIFTSDHGFHMGEKEFLFKNSVWHESLHIPLVFAGPDIATGEIAHPVSLLDLYPTLVGLSGLPADPNKNTNQLPLDGYSLVPFLKEGDGAIWQGPDFATSVVQGTEITNMQEENAVFKQHYIATTAEYSYVLCNNGEEELYDKINDPFEWHNLSKDKEYDDVKADLKQKLKDQISNYVSP